jgi:hypothetical protein
MATKVFLFSPGVTVETVVEGVGSAVQSSFVVGLTINTATNTINEGASTRMILKSEVQMAIRTLEEFILKDPNADWG